MHWSEQIALKIIERNPDKEEYVCAAGVSPSGMILITITVKDVEFAHTNVLQMQSR